MEEQGMTEKKERIRRASNSKLPKSETLDPEIQERVEELLNRSNYFVVKKSEIEESIEELGNEMAAICEAYELPGFRHQLYSFEYFGWKTKKTLSKEALLALGVPAATIEQAYVDSKPFISKRINPFDAE